MKPYLCIYHGNCADGFTAAWILRNALGEENVDFVPGFYGKDLMATPPPSPLGVYDCIYLVDFSYKHPTLLAVASLAKKIIIIDHHKTAKDDLIDLPANVECVFDMEHSGAMLVWMYFQCKSHNAEEGAYDSIDLSTDCEYWGIDAKDAPALIQRVEDRDLWKFRFYDTRAVAAKMFSHEYTFENWDRMAVEYSDRNSRIANDLKTVFIAEGEAIERKHFKDIKELLAACQTRGNILDYNVPIANLPGIHSSDAGHIMAKGEPFAACYWYTATHCVFSLRSEEEVGVDVSEIAKQFGGGGHKHAAGFQIPIDQLPGVGMLGNKVNEFTIGVDHSER